MPRFFGKTAGGGGSVGPPGPKGDTGATGPAGPAGSSSGVSPSDFNFKGWVLDPAVLNSGTRTAPAAGIMVGSMLYLPASTLTAVHYHLGAAGAGVTNCYLGLIDVATGNRICVTNDIASTVQSSGFKRSAFSAPTAWAGGLVYLVALVGGATTSPAFVKNPNTDNPLLNIRGNGMPAGRFRSGTITSQTGLTAIPTTNDLSTNVAANTGPWGAIE